MTTSQKPSLALLSLNVNGLGQKAKRHTLFACLIDGPWDVVLLQETHHADEEQGIQWTREGAGQGRPWPGSCFWAEGTTASRGVAVLLKHSTDTSSAYPLSVDQHDGRVLRVDFTWQQQPLTVIAVYAPCLAADRQTFFTQTLLPVLPQSGHILMGGDFNCVSSDLDVTPNAAGRRRSGYAQGLQLVEETFGLNDAWRVQHPTDRDITHTCASDMSGARLDRWLVSTDVLFQVQQTHILEGLPGDHLGATIKLQAQHSPLQGPKPWSFPLQLLDDTAYQAQLKHLVLAMLEERPISPQLSHGQRWDDLKREIREHATEYARRCKLQASAIEKVLRQRASAARMAFAANPAEELKLASWQLANAALQTYIHDKAQAAALRAGVLWQHYGEQSTFYFHYLGKQRQLATAIPSVTDSMGNTFDMDSTDSIHAGGQALAAFFSSQSTHGLFTPSPTCSEAQKELLESVDAFLGEEASSTCEGAQPITLEELTKALAGLPRGKQPGGDGLPYEFLHHYWKLLGPILHQVYLESFSPGGKLTRSQAMGSIVLLYKGKGSRSDPASYRPITLLNTDLKLLAKALTDRWAGPVSSIVDTTQTAFLPDRWIGDNVLAHLETVEYLELAKEPGCMAFLDFSKAYDRLDRPWLLQCMERMRFGPTVRRWVEVLHTDLTAQVRYNGWKTPSFPVNTGLAQGSPLSPLLFVLAAQPLAAHLRRQVHLGTITPLMLPDGTPAPPSHQHADDTSLHLRTRLDLFMALEGSVKPFCQASGSRLNAAKSQAMVLGGDSFQGLDEPTGITFVPRGACLRHLGIWLSTDSRKAAVDTYTAILGAVRQAANHWISKQLTQIGRVHVAKQVLASKVTYHATFLPIPEAQAKELTTTLVRFVSGGTSTLRPSRAAYALPWEQGGMRLIQLHHMTSSLRAKVISRLLEPERMVWKMFADQHFGRQAAWLQDHPHVAQTLTGGLNYGKRILFSTRRTQDLGISSSRFKAYVQAFRSLQPHRLVQPDALTHEQVMVEPLFYNLQVQHEGAPLSHTGQFLPLARRGITTVGHLQTCLAQSDDALIQLVLDSLPPSWRSHLHHQATQARWLEAADLSLIFGRLGADGEDQQWTAFRKADNHRLIPEPTCPPLPAELRPVAVLSWDPARLWRPGRQDAPSQAGHYLLGSFEAATSDPNLWGFGKMPAHQLIVREAATRLTTMAAVQQGILPCPSAACRPAIWAGDSRSGLEAIEARWLSFLGGISPQEASPLAVRKRTATQATDLDYAQGTRWMALSHPHRKHWRSRQADAQVEDPVPVTHERGASLDDTLDRASVGTSHTQPWKQVWRRLHDLSLDRSHRQLAWKVLHGSLPCGAYRAYVKGQKASTDRLALLLEEARCPHCSVSMETLSHMLLDCPVAKAVWHWVSRVFASLSVHSPPPLTPAILLADDQAAWHPPPTLQPAWTQLRLATLASLFSGASDRRKGIAVSSISIAARVIASIRAAIQRDWKRVSSSSDGLSRDICCSSWLRGRHTSLTLTAFRQTWAAGGSLCHVSSDGALTVAFSLTVPAMVMGDGQGLRVPHTN